MPNSRLLIQRTLAILGLALATALLAHAQGGNVEGKTTEQVYKNIQVLRGLPAEQLNDAMHIIRGALGVGCEFCHVETDRSADTLKTKQTARMMMIMMATINKNFAGKQEVTCFTCHRGSPIPAATIGYPSPPAFEEETKLALPSVDQILGKYVAALGGEQALRKVTSRVITGTQYMPTGPGGEALVPGAIERDQKAPNLSVNIYRTATTTMSEGFDGTKAWAQNAQGRVTDLLNSDQGRVKREADLYSPLDIKQQYTKIEVQGIEKIDDHDAYVVAGTAQGELPEQLFFDVQTGLLVRKQSALPSPVGDYPLQVNYADYRDTGSGVKFPFLITMYPATPGLRANTPSSSTTIRVTKVQDNAPLDSAKFTKPQPKPAPAQ